MKKIISLILFSLFFSHGWGQPRPEKLSNTIIIDTDCAIDDLRALSLLLARPEINIRAIIASEGSLPPSEGVIRIAALLDQFGKNDIPVFIGESLKGVNPPWREFNMNVTWGNTQNGKPSGSGLGEYFNTLEISAGKTTLVCLGPLTNIGSAIRRDASVLTGIDRIVWYNESDFSGGFNYETDKKNADLVIGSGIRIDMISNLDADKAYFDTELVELCAHSETTLAGVLTHVFSQPVVSDKLKENHFRLYDDLVALYLTNPDLFAINRDLKNKNVRFNSGYNVQAVREAMSDMITGIYVKDESIVFNRFPASREMFAYDVRPLIDSAIARYGIEEWKANVMTDEFHGHLGVFSIVGAKMGIKARELLGVGPDMLDVITFAGTKPPYSCLTDGIQVSTGATLGMGTIHPGPDSIRQPSAIFIHSNKRAFRITLKKEYLDQVDRDINEGILKFGLLDDGYWKLIRHNALKYWLEWDRDKIFDIVEIAPPAYK